MPQARRRPWSRTLEFTRDQRKEPSVEEGRLWERWRNRKLGGSKFRRQGTIGRYIVDFVCFEAKLIVEIDGGVHGLPGRREKDEIRQKWLEREGYRVLRFSDMDCHHDIDRVLALIAESVVGAVPSPLAPLPQGERGN